MGSGNLMWTRSVGQASLHLGAFWLHCPDFCVFLSSLQCSRCIYISNDPFLWFFLQYLDHDSSGLCLNDKTLMLPLYWDMPYRVFDIFTHKPTCSMQTIEACLARHNWLMFGSFLYLVIFVCSSAKGTQLPRTSLRIFISTSCCVKHLTYTVYSISIISIWMGKLRNWIDFGNISWYQLKTKCTICDTNFSMWSKTNHLKVQSYQSYQPKCYNEFKTPQWIKHFKTYK